MLQGVEYAIQKTVGIDLGTTNSVIALLDSTDSAILTGQDEQGRLTFPSVVAWHPEQQRLVAGRAAQALRIPSANRTEGILPLSSVKRFMGLDRRFALGPESLSPPEASACVLRLLRDMLARRLNDPRYRLDAAVITIPAYFNHPQIEATRQAGELAGYEVVELLHEPTAAAIYYSWVENHADATYLVYDLGGGTFDVSVIRRRLGDYEVLGVSGDPFLGGDDFDRLLASHLIETGVWIAQPLGDRPGGPVAPEVARPLFDPATPEGALHFAHLVHVAESMKVELTESERNRADRYLPDLVRDAAGRLLSLEVSVEREAFQRQIRDKVHRTIDCCHEALARARDRAGLRLGDIDHVILVGGSSRVPLVRETVRQAFCNPDLPERVRNPEPLLHEPDLCVAYGAALRAATHGTRYRIAECGLRIADSRTEASLELHWTSPVHTRETRYHATGVVRTVSLAGNPQSAIRNPQLEGASVRLRSLATGLIDEVFLDDRGTFAQEIELQGETDNVLEAAVCDGDGRELGCVPITVRHLAAARRLGQAVLPTQLITKPLQIEVLNRGRQRVKQVVAPIGATLPGTFACTCRTQDQAGRIVLPIYEENRVIKQMVVSELDPSLPVGTPVEVELAIDARHAITVRVRVAQAATGKERTESATIEPPPPPSRPTRAEIEEVQNRIEELLGQYTGSFRTRMKSRAQQLQQDLNEALHYDDEPKAIQRMAELRDLLQQLETSRGQMLEPPWPRFAQQVRSCLDLAAEVADTTRRQREELFEYVHAQERYAQQAYEEHNQGLYRECCDNLQKYAVYLRTLLEDALPRPPAGPTLPPEEEARQNVERFRSYLSTVWKKVRAAQRDDLHSRLTEIAGQAGGLSQRVKGDPHAVLREVRRLGTEVHKVEEQLERQSPVGDDAGLLEGSS
jgi:molecular chaperone DnaK